jgi:hypothetical protein
MTDHHDFGDHHFGDDPLPFEEHSLPAADHVPEPDQADVWDHHDDHLGDAWDHPDLPAHDEPEVTPEPEPPLETDVPDLSEMSVEVFPPSLDVGELPEPVDGFPWIDSGSLGLADIAAALHDHAADTDPVPAQEVADYAGTDLPPGADPWAALAGSDDPAVSALARWWTPR